ncbi:hypothetical protein XU18_4318 [Perkinsela sp. CCAP 1560/4]|nr:hypothetical protein XU18_4318 [Perkinsela sp. CCAP 1560/4]|eukprot:KNH04459.1 hypothetical protein XU18_4318 [Perkinsela sp. CCAP 1560/4]
MRKIIVMNLIARYTAVVLDSAVRDRREAASSQGWWVIPIRTNGTSQYLFMSAQSQKRRRPICTFYEIVLRKRTHHWQLFGCAIDEADVSTKERLAERHERLIHSNEKIATKLIYEESR